MNLDPLGYAPSKDAKDLAVKLASLFLGIDALLASKEVDEATILIDQWSRDHAMAYLLWASGEKQKVDHCAYKFPLEICDNKGCRCSHCDKPVNHEAPRA
jgi:hypothetical protein